MAELKYNHISDSALNGSAEQNDKNPIFNDQDYIDSSSYDTNLASRKLTTAEYISNKLLGWASFGKNQVIPKVASTFCQFGQYAKTAFLGHAPKEETAESSGTYSITRGIESALVNLALPALALYADASLIGSTVVTATVATCAVNVISLGVKSGATYVAAEKAQGFNEIIDSGLSIFNSNVVKTTKDLCFLEHKVIWEAQKIVGYGVTKIADNIQDPSDLIAAGKSVASVALNLWDSAKYGCECVSKFMGGEYSSETHEEGVGL